MFDTPLSLFYGLLTGLMFGFLLQKAGVTRYRVILGQFLWRDHTVLRTMVTAVVVGSIGVYFMHQVWGVALHVKATEILANVVGGLVFGVGMAVLGYCPGTGVGAMGDGSRHAIAGVLGMLAGAAVYAELYPLLSTSILEVGDYGKVTIPSGTGISPWGYIVVLAAAAIVVFQVLPQRGSGEPPKEAA
jgi:uncharacterized membrane protein YedE/YeeE